MNETKAHWEEHYGERDRVWSGRVNVQFADVAADLPPGRALDLGCGEGADSVWLAERGWNVVAVDISETALGRAREAASSRGVSDRIEFVALDLSDGFPDGDIRPGLSAIPAFHRPAGPDDDPCQGGAGHSPGRAAGHRRPRLGPAMGVEAGSPPRIPERRRGGRRSESR